jgi:hypothetical protein
VGPEDREIKIKIMITITITIKKKILNFRFAHPEGVTDGSRSVEARRDLRISVGRNIAP